MTDVSFTQGMHPRKGTIHRLNYNLAAPRNEPRTVASVGPRFKPERVYVGEHRSCLLYTSPSPRD
eukprot:4973529-Alexandrium_andersonii.AAC.1